MQISEVFTGKRYGLINYGSEIILVSNVIDFFHDSGFYWLYFDRT